MDAMHSGFFRRLRRGCGISILVLFWDVAVFSTAKCEAHVAVAGNHESLLVVVDNDTVDHVLEALGNKANSRYHSAKPLNKIISGSFSGSLWQVLSRILDGFDYAVVGKPAGVEIFVYGASNSYAVQAPPSAQPVKNETTAIGANVAPLRFPRPPTKSYSSLATYGDPRVAPVLQAGGGSR
jgi:hypothetical protein